ncbi:tetraacyldisaccharide 4'-kinase [Betaproteobacteria bacterium]|nr:tetraacyldisaccharide 4'-kinase [Betaproteobacteria bacterium]
MSRATPGRTTPGFWQRRAWRAWALLPLALLFRALVGLRRQLYRCGVLGVERLPTPVIVVGNIAVGGSGKTPAVVWLVGVLRAAGFRPAIVSRGHGGTGSGERLVDADADPAQCGDEPVLLARLACCPVAVGRDRPAAARLVLAAHPECDVIVADDGMQHYRLGRTLEIAVVDEATLGNRWPLPAGPLREPLARLGEVDLILAHGELSPPIRAAAAEVAVAGMRLVGERFRALNHPEQWCAAAAFGGQNIHAIAGIGQPQRFFNQLRALGLNVIPHPFPDHHPYCAADLAFAPGEVKVMTSKDAVKCSAFAPDEAWEFPVEAVMDGNAADRILERLQKWTPDCSKFSSARCARGRSIT